MRFRRTIRPRPDGTLEVRLGDAERALLLEVAAGLVADLDGAEDPSLRRLFPPAYADDAVRDAGFQMMMGDELRQRYLAAARTLADTARTENLDPSEAELWLRSINAARLVLGTRLDITDDAGPVRVARDDPRLGAWIAYEFLSRVLDDLVTAMSL